MNRQYLLSALAFLGLSASAPAFAQTTLEWIVLSLQDGSATAHSVCVTDLTLITEAPNDDLVTDHPHDDLKLPPHGGFKSGLANASPPGTTRVMPGDNNTLMPVEDEILGLQSGTDEVLFAPAGSLRLGLVAAPETGCASDGRSYVTGYLVTKPSTASLAVVFPLAGGGAYVVSAPHVGLDSLTYLKDPNGGVALSAEVSSVCGPLGVQLGWSTFPPSFMDYTDDTCLAGASDSCITLPDSLESLGFKTLSGMDSFVEDRTFDDEVCGYGGDIMEGNDI